MPVNPVTGIVFMVKTPSFLAIPWLALGLFALPNEVLNADQHTGTVAGQVTITRKLSAQRMRFRLYPSFKPIAPPPERCGGFR